MSQKSMHSQRNRPVTVVDELVIPLELYMDMNRKVSAQCQKM